MNWLLSRQRGLHVGFLLLQYSVLCVVLSPYLCLFPFFLNLYVLGDDAWIS